MSASDGPKVVAIGGGHGLAASLRAVRTYTDHVTAVVSVADDGGSTGRLRAVGAATAPGDLRKCLVALSPNDSTLRRSMDHRFVGGDMDGHAMGNLLILAMTESAGDLVRALDEIASLLGAEGRVLPATRDAVQLTGSSTGGELVSGQVAVSGRSDLCRVAVEPAGAEASPEAVEAIIEAHQIVLGPGSLYTSVLAATAVPGIAEAVRRSSAQLVYVCNLRPQPGETTGYGVSAHVDALHRHGLEPDVVLYDPAAIGSAAGVDPAVPATLATPGGLAHEPDLLGAALASLIEP
ncbi:MAG: gluconeogenesis factor YvcK family protein [Microthrixaceae bacterium]